MSRLTSGLLATSLVLAGAIGIFSVTSSSAGPFGGSEAGGGTQECGTGLDCPSDTFTAAAASGSGFICSSALSSCIDMPGANNDIGTNGTTLMYLGPPASASGGVQIGANLTLFRSGSILMNGGLDLYNSGFIQQTIGGAVKVTDTDGLSINSGTAIIRRYRQAVSLDFGSITNGTTATLTGTVTGAQTGDRVVVTRCTALEADIGDLQPWVSATNTVSLQVRNFGGAPVDPAACSFVFEVTQ